jgi:hypothetical protein
MTATSFVQMAPPAGRLAGEALRLCLTSTLLTPLPIGRLLFFHGLFIDQPLTLDSFV